MLYLVLLGICAIYRRLRSPEIAPSGVIREQDGVWQECASAICHDLRERLSVLLLGAFEKWAVWAEAL